MSNLTLQFTVDDVYSKLLVSEGRPGVEHRSLSHDLLGDSYDAFATIDGFMGSFKGGSKSGILAEIRRIKELGNISNGNVKKMIPLIWSKDGDSDEAIRNSLKQYWDGMNELSSALISLDASYADEAHSPEQDFHFGRVMHHMKLAVYTHNLKFAKNMRRESYMFHADVLNLLEIVCEGKANPFPFSLDKPGLADLETKQNYAEKVVLPLFKNMQQHGLNSDNDIYHRLDEKGNLSAMCSIQCNPNEADSNIAVKVYDGGLGMSPKVAENIFEQGFTTKTDTTDEHGIGLWAVKEFVEEQGGTIAVDSVLGRMTMFNFTIPYTSVDNHFYKQ